MHHFWHTYVSMESFDKSCIPTHDDIFSLTAMYGMRNQINCFFLFYWNDICWERYMKNCKYTGLQICEIRNTFFQMQSQQTNAKISRKCYVVSTPTANRGRRLYVLYIHTHGTQWYTLRRCGVEKTIHRFVVSTATSFHFTVRFPTAHNMVEHGSDFAARRGICMSPRWPRCAVFVMNSL